MMLYTVLVRLWCSSASVDVSTLADYASIFAFAYVAIPWVTRRIVKYILDIVDELRNNRGK